MSSFPLTFDRIGEKATTTGTGNFTLAGALYGFKTFAAKYAVSDVFYYVIEHLTSEEWEVGLGKLVTNTTTLSRVAILASSNAGAAVSFSSGQKRVYITSAAEAIGPRYHTMQARLTLATGTPVPVVDQTGKTTIYLTPYNGNEIWLFTNGHWQRYELAEVSLAPALAASKVYDVFVYDNAGTITLETVVWTDDNTRATALQAQDGVWLKSSDLTRRWVGSFRTSAASQMEDSVANRLVFNLYNQVQRSLQRLSASEDGYTYSTNTYRQVNANAANQVTLLCGLAGQQFVSLQAQHLFSAAVAADSGNVGIGVDSSTVSSAMGGRGTPFTACACAYSAHPTLGYRVYKWLEKDLSAPDVFTWFPSFGGMMGFCLG